jgi:probable addiction module antidote protein
MSATKTNLMPFDATHYLTDEASIAAYLDAVLESEDPDLLLLALGDVARARGMTDVARKAGLGRESLYKALIPGAQPRLPTVMKVLHALGLRLRVEALEESPAQSA